MSESPTPDNEQSAPNSQPSFEEALAKLEEIVGELEEGSLGLQESMESFEQGVTLLKNCYRLLERAEQRIEMLTGFTEDGRPELEPFDATATTDKQAATSKTRDRDADR